MKKVLLGVLLGIASVHAYALDDHSGLGEQIDKMLAKHYDEYHDKEYFSAISVAVYQPKLGVKSHFIGRVSHKEDSAKIDENTLFQIGSITKSFTAALVLDLEKEGLLKTYDTVEKWLPIYPKWKSVTIRQMLNMTSGLPNYSDMPLWNVAEYSDPGREWSNAELVDFAYPRDTFAPPLKRNYFYTNTGYILADMIVRNATNQSFAKSLRERVINKVGLKNTFYPLPKTPQDVRKRMASGYAYNQYDNPYLLGKDMKGNNLSWGAAAGAIIANPSDIVRWVKALFIDNVLLDQKQKGELMSLASVKTGRPISGISTDDPKGFGLGVIKNFNPEIGAFWYYEGETLGYRALYMYVPCNQVIVAATINSATNSENDHAGELMTNLYRLILSNDSALICKSK